MQKRQKDSPPARFLEISYEDASFPLSISREEKHLGLSTKLPHVHSGFEIGYCHEGSGIFAIGNRIYVFHKGDVFALNPMEPHIVKNKAGDDSVWTWIYFDPLRLLADRCKQAELLDVSFFGGAGFRNVFPGEQFPLVNMLVKKMIGESKTMGTFGRESISASLMCLMVEFHQSQASCEKKDFDKAQQAEAIIPALRYISQHYGEKISIKQMAECCFMGESSFRQQFARAMQRTAYQYVLQYRISMASIELKQDKKNLDQIARDNGFPTLSCFIRKFKAAMGASPRKWVKQAGS